MPLRIMRAPAAAKCLRSGPSLHSRLGNHVTCPLAAGNANVLLAGRPACLSTHPRMHAQLCAVPTTGQQAGPGASRSAPRHTICYVRPRPKPSGGTTWTSGTAWTGGPAWTGGTAWTGGAASTGGTAWTGGTASTGGTAWTAVRGPRASVAPAGLLQLTAGFPLEGCRSRGR